jgi:hypothetical protein
MSANNNIKSILITDDVNQKCVEILENNNFLVKKNIKLSKEELLNEIKVIFKKKKTYIDYDFVIVI